MIYTVNYKSWYNIDFKKHLWQLNAAVNNYNRISINASNPKRILSLRVINSFEIEIQFYSKKTLAQSRAANALWLFSHDLVKNHGFDIYLTSHGKLLKSA